MESYPRQKLCELITSYGRNLCDEPKRLKGMLRDCCPQHTREVNVLLIALEQKVPRALLGGLVYELTAHQLIKQLYDDVGMAEEVARWTVDTWALALGVIQVIPDQPSVRQVVPDSETRPVVTPSPPPKKRVGEVFRDRLQDGSSGPEMVWISAGKFKMGSNEYDSEKPIHEVTIAYDFAMGKYPVTVGEFKQFVQATGYKTEAEKGGGAYIWTGEKWENKKDAHWKNPYISQTDRHPVVCMSWNDVRDYCEWLSEQTGNRYRLPSEAEWEYACRAGTTTKFSFGDNDNDLQHYGWFNSNSGNKTHPVGEKKPNAWGLYDMHGNVWEWCEDVWHGNYKGAPTDGSAWLIGGEQGRRALRGGCWYFKPNWVRAATRDGYDLTDRNYNGLGVRVIGFPR